MAQSSIVPDFAREVLERRVALKRDAAKRLLLWGFTPTEISAITGCDADWVEQRYAEHLETAGQQ